MGLWPLQTNQRKENESSAANTQTLRNTDQEQWEGI